MTAADEITCEELVELVTDYLEGAMEPEERTRFAEHLAACEGCANYVRQMERTVELSGALKEKSIPAPVRAELLRAFRDWKAGRAS